MRICKANSPLLAGKQTAITGEDAKHISKVLRIKAGETISVSGSDNICYRCEVISSSKNEVVIMPQGQPVIAALPLPKVNLLFAINKPPAMEMALQKAAELSVSCFTPLATHYATSQTLSANKQQRLLKIASESCKQSGRADVMEVAETRSMKNLSLSGLTILLWEGDVTPLNIALSKTDTPDEVNLIIGPIGGFSDEELALMKERKYMAASLGSLILKADTAAIAAISAINFRFGRMKR